MHAHPKFRPYILSEMERVCALKRAKATLLASSTTPQFLGTSLQVAPEDQYLEMLLLFSHFDNIMTHGVKSLCV